MSVRQLRDLDYWQLSSRIEAGRAEVLKMAAEGKPLADILNALCANSEIYNPEMKSSVLRYDEPTATLHTCASVSLPQSYSDALDGTQVGMGVGSCGTAAFSKQRVIVEDINTHPYWAQYKGLALAAGLQACWSEPILGANGKCFGTFAIYYQTPKRPSEEDLNYIKTCANLAAVIFESDVAKQQLLDANTKLSQTVDQRNQELQKANEELSKLLENQSRANKRSVNLQKAETTKVILRGFAHEINTPLGVAITALSYAQEQVKQLQSDVQNAAYQANAKSQIGDIVESMELMQSNLNRASGLITKFKQIDADTQSNTKDQFTVNEFLSEISTYYQKIHSRYQYKFVADTGLNLHHQTEFWQILTHLIENSIVHGFKNREHGSISIFATQKDGQIEFNYQDDGCGINDAVRETLFDPFTSTARTSGFLGLGMSIASNLLSTVFNGTITLLDSPIGARFRISIPLGE